VNRLLKWNIGNFQILNVTGGLGIPAQVLNSTLASAVLLEMDINIPLQLSRVPLWHKLIVEGINTLQLKLVPSAGEDFLMISTNSRIEPTNTRSDFAGTRARTAFGLTGAESGKFTVAGDTLSLTGLTLRASGTVASETVSSTSGLVTTPCHRQLVQRKRGSVA
jgi:hypothetical protein